LSVAPSFDQVAILGTGLIGTSLALALRSQEDPPALIGFDLDGENRRGAAAQKTAAGVKAFDRVSGSLPEAVKDADLVVVSTPVRAMETLFRELSALGKPGAVVTDTGSTKRWVLTWADQLLSERLQFVGGHPMAGKVSAGPWEAEAAIFQGATYCLCPLPRTDRGAVERTVGLVQGLGAAPYFVDAHEHDGLVAAVSHLPYLASVALVNSVAGPSSWRESATLAAGGFATVSHLAESDPQMFTDICLTNREAVVRQLDGLIDELANIRKAVAAGDESIGRIFDGAQAHHRDWLSGRAAEGGHTRQIADPASLRPGLFTPTRLGHLIRGRGGDKNR
jgi:prephenate dehydrogenase